MMKEVIEKKRGLGTDEERAEAHLKKRSDWGVAAYVAAIVFVVAFYFYFLRSGIFNPFQLSGINYLFYVNKTLGATGMVLITVGLLIGPLAKFCPRKAGWVEYRKEIGIVGFLLAALHGFISLFLLPEVFDSAWFGENWLSILLAVAAVGVLLFISMFSNNAAIMRLGFRKWKFIQRLVYVALIVAVVHVFLLDRIGEWGDWFKFGDSVLPPIALAVVIFVGIVLVLRVVMIFVDRREEVRAREKAGEGKRERATK